VIKDISMEDTKENKSATLFGEGFMEKAAKRMEEEKTLSKFTSSPKEMPVAKRRKYLQDLCHFLEKGAPAQYGSRRYQHQQPHNQNHNWNRSYKQPQPQPQQQARPPKKQSKQ